MRSKVIDNPVESTVETKQREIHQRPHVRRKPCEACGLPMSWRQRWAKNWADVNQESSHVWSSKQRIAPFLAAMRHFAVELQMAGRRVHYTRLGNDHPMSILNRHTLMSQVE